MSWEGIMKEEPVNNAELREVIQHQEFIVKAIRGYMENFQPPIPQGAIESQTNRAVVLLEFLKRLDLEHQSIDTELPSNINWPSRDLSNEERLAQLKQILDEMKLQD